MTPPSLRSSNLIASFRHAFAGVGYALRTQRNAQIHLAATILAVLLGFWLALGTTQWCLILMAIGLVWMSELSNTALENIVDLITPEYNELAKTAKDLKAGAVVAAAFAAAGIGILVLGPPLFLRLQLLLGAR